LVGGQSSKVITDNPAPSTKHGCMTETARNHNATQKTESHMWHKSHIAPVADC
jgi:hypothetical protein